MVNGYIFVGFMTLLRQANAVKNQPTVLKISILHNKMVMWLFLHNSATVLGAYRLMIVLDLLGSVIQGQIKVKVKKEVTAAVFP